MSDPTPDELHEARLGTFRVLAHLHHVLREGLDEEDQGLLLALLDATESELVQADRSDVETYAAIGRFRRALQGPGLTLMERAELAAPGGFLDQVEGVLL